MDIDLVLSGSGTRFPIFIGGLKALEEKNITVKRVAGTSGGALVAAALASKLSAEDMEKIILGIDFNTFKDFSIFTLFTKYGIYSGKKIEEFVDNFTKGKTFREVDLDIRMIATDILKGHYFIFSKYTTPNVKLSKAVRYSLSIPIFFGLEKYKETYLVDGLVSSNYALDIFDDNQRKTIGFRTSSKNLSTTGTKFGLLKYIMMCIETLMISIEKEHIEDAYWADSILLDSKVNPLNFDLTNADKLEMIKLGYNTVLDNLGS